MDSPRSVSSRTAVAASAPGKVLFAGGYLVLDRQYTGLVFGLDARIHVCAEHADTRDRPTTCHIHVRSPQFKDANWKYGLPGTTDGGGVQFIPIEDSESPTASRNPFVETTLNYALSYIAFVTKEPLTRPLSITIFADNDYYSEIGSSIASPVSTGTFANFGVPLRQANKTGLGSSAALVTALTAALLALHLPKMNGFGTEVAKSVLHNLAQAAHCAAQGKVGSGFDVAAAVYGSCVYRRFSPSLLDNVSEAGSPVFQDRLFAVVEDLGPEQKWDTEVIKSAVDVPQGLTLVMCDVDCGSQTPGMVKKVLSWRKENPEEAGILWGALQKGNEELCEELKRLSLPHGRPEDFSSLRDTILTIRSLIREMSKKSGVPIEPRVQTELLDACSRVPGVVGGVTPGAGGYDAIALLINDDDSVVKALQNVLEHWESSVEEDGEVKIGKVRLLGVKQEMEGIRLESYWRYRGI